MTDPLSSQKGGQLSIGEVLNSLRGEFSDISISKIRFLESEGLIEPGRSNSGYRKFSTDDIMRLRYILRTQRDHYLPLKVIKEHLAALDRGLEPPDLVGVEPQVPKVSHLKLEKAKKPIRLTEDELLHESGLEPKQLAELEKLGLISRLPDLRHFNDWALNIAKIAAALCNYGLEPRHLRGFKTAADREFSLIKQVTTPFSKRKHPDAVNKANEMMVEIAQLTNLLQAALIQSTLEDEI
jgi:DNA-binding transcriptional MerR regulator